MNSTSRKDNNLKRAACFLHWALFFEAYSIHNLLSDNYNNMTVLIGIMSNSIIKWFGIDIRYNKYKKLIEEIINRGLLMSLFRKKNISISPSSGLTSRETGVTKPKPTLRVHSDLTGLLWIADGPKKNYSPEVNRTFKIEAGDYTITIVCSGNQEPSLISTRDAVELNPAYVEKLPYFPSYAEMSPAQRGVYWKFLENPYNPSFEIGYVFVLYYGLERHLLLGDYEKAINIIIKLRDVHANGSFQSYSANAIILTCLKNKRADLLFRFLQSLDNEYEYSFSDNLYLFSKYSLEQPLDADDIIRTARSFEYTKRNYIKDYPELFKETLTSNMIAAFGEPEVLCSRYIKRSDYRKLPKESVPIFANVSIIDKQIEVPLIVHSFQFKKVMNDLLNQTHEDVKKLLADMRKNGTVPQKASNSQKAKVIEAFDALKEKELLERYKACEPGTVQEHYVSIELQEFYYKYRNLDDKYLQECIRYCNDDVTKLQSIQLDYVSNEKAWIVEHSKMMNLSQLEIDKELAKVTLFNFDIPALKRLAIIYEKQKDYEKAIAVCDAAVRYYTVVKNELAIEDFTKRKERLVEKR